jgi:toxin-antitoxin system PIN domain toxin
MTLVDANVLLYAVNVAAAQHASAKAWLDQALSSEETVGLPWVSLLAFVRIATHPAIFPAPLTVAQAMGVVTAWAQHPSVANPEPLRGFPERLTQALHDANANGNLTNDAYLAALAGQYGATVVTFDRDFTRFKGIKSHILRA